MKSFCSIGVFVFFPISLIFFRSEIEPLNFVFSVKIDIADAPFSI